MAPKPRDLETDMTELKPKLTMLRGTGLMLNIVVGAGLLALP